MNVKKFKIVLNSNNLFVKSIPTGVTNTINIQGISDAIQVCSKEELELLSVKDNRVQPKGV